MSLEWFKKIGILIVPIVFLLPLEFIQSLPSLCLFKSYMGFDCWGCGITRALFLTLHFQFQEAIALNLGVLAVFPMLLRLYLINLFSFVDKGYILIFHRLARKVEFKG